MWFCWECSEKRLVLTWNVKIYRKLFMRKSIHWNGIIIRIDRWKKMEAPPNSIKSSVFWILWIFVDNVVSQPISLKNIFYSFLWFFVKKLFWEKKSKEFLEKILSKILRIMLNKIFVRIYKYRMRIRNLRINDTW